MLLTNEEKIERVVQWLGCSKRFATDLLAGFNWNYDEATDWYWRNVILTCDQE